MVAISTTTHQTGLLTCFVRRWSEHLLSSGRILLKGDNIVSTPIQLICSSP